MLSRVTDLAKKAEMDLTSTDFSKVEIKILIATEDQRIADHASEIGVDCVMTSDECRTGSDRVLEAAKKSGGDFDFIISLQGDAPFTPPEALTALIYAAAENKQIEVVTPVVALSWGDLDRLRDNKKQTPFSGTTVTIDKDGRALWFSKNIIPAIRKEDKLRQENPSSPVYQHLGLYGYRADILEKFVALPEGHYESLEGLEQLRLLENNISIQTVEIDIPNGAMQAGIDSPEDIERAEMFLKKNA